MNPKWEENYQRIMKANQNSQRTIYFTEQDKIDFIERCEKVYGTTTKMIIEKLEQNGNEGSPEIRKWFQFAKELNYK